MEEKNVKGAESVAKKGAKSSTMLTFENTQVENRLTFKPDARFNGICQGRISDVRLEMHEALKINPETGVESQYEYAGHTVPTLCVELRQEVDPNVNPKPRYYTHRFTIIPTRKKDGEAMDDKVIVSLITSTYEKLRHMLNAYVGCKEYNTDMGTPPGIDYTASVKERIEMFTAFFEWFVKAFEGTGETPMYKNYKLWIKLVASDSGKYLTFPKFVGKGFVERIIPQQATTLQKEPRESFELTEKKSSATERSATPHSTGDDELDDILKDYK